MFTLRLRESLPIDGTTVRCAIPVSGVPPSVCRGDLVCDTAAAEEGATDRDDACLLQRLSAPPTGVEMGVEALGRWGAGAVPDLLSGRIHGAIVFRRRSPREISSEIQGLGLLVERTNGKVLIYRHRSAEFTFRYERRPGRAAPFTR